MKANAVDVDGIEHRAREWTEGRGAEPDRVTCTCGKKFADTPAQPDWQAHLRDVEVRDGARALTEARRKLDDARSRHDSPRKAHDA